MIYTWEGNNDWTWAANQLEELISMSNETQLVKQYLKSSNPIDWANESFGYVRSTCYNFSTVDTRVHHHPIIQSEPDIGPAYYDRNQPIVVQRLIAAGVRLAALLNRVLTG